MKKIDLINLIKYHYQSKNEEFQNLSFLLAKEFEKENDTYAAGLIESIINSNYSFTNQASLTNNTVLEEMDTNLKHALYLSDYISDDIFGVINAIKNKVNVRRFLFVGKPGTGKTETAKYIANDVSRKLYSVNFTSLISAIDLIPISLFEGNKYTPTTLLGLLFISFINKIPLLALLVFSISLSLSLLAVPLSVIIVIYSQSGLNTVPLTT